MSMASWVKTVAEVIMGMFIPALAVLSTTSSWAALGTPYMVLIMVVGGARALRGYWSGSPLYKNLNVTLPGDSEATTESKAE